MSKHLDVLMPHLLALIEISSECFACIMFYFKFHYYTVFSTLMKIMITNTSKHVIKNDCIAIKSTKCKKNDKNKGDDVGILHQFVKSRFVVLLC